MKFKYKLNTFEITKKSHPHLEDLITIKRNGEVILQDTLSDLLDIINELDTALLKLEDNQEAA